MENLIHLDSIYVLILNYQSYEDTINYVGNLQKQENIDLHILIVDNCSPNKSFNILKSRFQNIQNVEVIQSEKNGGYAYGNNFGLRYLEQKNIDYILVSNNDIEIGDSLLLYKMIQEYKTLKNPAFISPVMYVNGKQSSNPAWKLPTLKDDIIGSLRLFEVFFDSFKTYEIQLNKSHIEADCLPGSFFMARKDIFYTLGLMDEKTFLYMEEAILAYKVKESNLKNYLLTNLKYEHLTSQTISNELSLMKMRKHLIDSRIYFHKEYLKTNEIGILLLNFLFYIWKFETFLFIRTKIASKKIFAKINQGNK